MATGTGGSKGRGRGPLAAWLSAQNALKVAIFRLKIEKFSGEGQCPLPREFFDFESKNGDF